jgi:hypothetical protein
MDPRYQRLYLKVLFRFFTVVCCKIEPQLSASGPAAPDLYCAHRTRNTTHSKWSYFSHPHLPPAQKPPHEATSHTKKLTTAHHPFSDPSQLTVLPQPHCAALPPQIINASFGLPE